MKNYLLHSVSINRQLVNVEQCSVDFELCGQSAGTIVKLLTGWTVSETFSEESDLQVTGTDFAEFFEGFVSSGNWLIPKPCSDLYGQGPKLTEVYSQVVNVLSRGPEAQKMALDLLAEIHFEKDVIEECYSTIAGIALGHIPSALGSRKAWKQMYYSESIQVVTMLQEVSASCPHNPSECGSAVSELLSLLVEYSF